MRSRFTTLSLVLMAVALCFGAVFSHGRGATSRTLSAEERHTQYAYRTQLDLRLLLGHWGSESHADDVVGMRCSRGGPDQLLRLLYWAVEPRPDLRRELLTQWLVEETTVPKEDVLISGLDQLMRCRSEEEVADRKREIAEVLAGVGKEKSDPSRTEKIRGKSIGYAPVDVLCKMKHFPSKGLSSPSVKERQEVYEQIPWSMPRGYDNEIDRGFFALLWAIEADDGLRVLYLRQRLEVSIIPDRYVDDPDFWVRTLSPLLEGMKDSEKEIRQQEILWMRPPVLTDAQRAAFQARIENQHQYVEQVRRRIAAEQEMLSSGTKTLEPWPASDLW